MGACGMHGGIIAARRRRRGWLQIHFPSAAVQASVARGAARLRRRMRSRHLRRSAGACSAYFGTLRQTGADRLVKRMHGIDGAGKPAARLSAPLFFRSTVQHNANGVQTSLNTVERI
jgi:hypothetical protein